MVLARFSFKGATRFSVSVHDEVKREANSSVAKQVDKTSEI